MASGRLKSPDDLIARFRWKSTGVSSLEHVEARYKHALIRYLRGKGIVRHPVFDMTSLTPEESAIAPDDPCARGLMFLMTVTGTLQLPPDDGQIEVGLFIMGSLVSNPAALTDEFYREIQDPGERG